MSSPPDNMKLEGLIADNWDEDAATPGIVALLEPYRAEIEDIAERFDADEQSWRDYRSAVWSPVPENVIDLVESYRTSQSLRSEPWVWRDGEPDIDSPDGVDLLVRDRYELLDLARAGLVITTHTKTSAGLVAHVRFPPRCARYRFLAGVGISVDLPSGRVTIEGPEPWRLRLVGDTDHRSVSGAPLADLAREVVKRGAFVAFEEPLDFENLIRKGVDALFCKLAPLFYSKTDEQAPPVPNAGTPVWELVVADVEKSVAPSRIRDALIDDMRKRDLLGRERYGTPLQANNGRDALLDVSRGARRHRVYAPKSRRGS